MADRNCAVFPDTSTSAAYWRPVRRPEQSSDSSVSSGALIAVSVLGQLGSFLLPYTLSALTTELSGREAWASYLIAAELGGLTFASALVSWRLPMLRIRLVGVLAIVGVGGGQFAAMASEGFVSLCAARVVTGVSEGVVLAIGYGLVARSAGAPRLFSYLTFFVTLAAAASLVSIPVLNRLFGADGAFVPQGIAAVIALGLATNLPEAVSANGSRPRLGWGVRAALSLLMAILLISLASNTLWEFAGQFSTGVGLTPDEFSVVAVVSTLLALGAGPLVYFARLKAGTLVPTVVAIAVQIVAAWAFSTTGSRTGFIASVLALNFLIVFIMPFLRTHLAEIDASGRATGLSAAAENLGMVIGPAVAGLLLSLGAGHRGTAALAAVGFILAGIAVTLATMHTRRRK
jgi:DHA1 family chloramphenicol resistance protein-like MFS transporter